jgi:hypothetical protein
MCSFGMPSRIRLPLGLSVVVPRRLTIGHLLGLSILSILLNLWIIVTGTQSLTINDSVIPDIGVLRSQSIAVYPLLTMALATLLHVACHETRLSTCTSLNSFTQKFAILCCSYCSFGSWQQHWILQERTVRKMQRDQPRFSRCASVIYTASF